MSIVTIPTLYALEQLLSKHANPTDETKPVHVIMLHLDAENMQDTGLSHAALVKKIRSHAQLKKVAVIFAEQDEEQHIIQQRTYTDA
ncbi:MAG: hypothetical protein Q9M19_00740 [Mariprofundaceae bacterium]|nr:hypothetical protein [Mariprofundaceae bacterium]